MNGYFQLIIKENETDIRLYPPTDGGQPVDIAEAVEYLAHRGITFDAGTMAEAYKAGGEGAVDIKVKDSPVLPERETYNMFVSSDSMEASARFYPPSLGGEKMTMMEFAKDMVHRGIRTGLQNENIKNFFKNRNYCEDILIARGIPPVQGRDGYVKYYFETDNNVTPAVNDDGSVDFFNLNIFTSVNAGDKLASIVRPDYGKMGIDIRGHKLAPRVVKVPRLQFGRNITISEDRTYITSQVSGHVSLVNEQVFVSNILEVQDVNTSTGNLDFDGSIVVNGNVNTNFELKATGNIEVKGVVEGAKLEAGGDIIIVRGANGMGKAELIAGRNIVSKFLENVTAKAGNTITTESILHSRVSAKDSVVVNGKKGFITGGRVGAGRNITVKTLGSAMGSDTTVEVGADPEVKAKFARLQKACGSKQAEMDQLDTVIDSYKKKAARKGGLAKQEMKYLQEVLLKKKGMEAELEELETEIEALSGEVTENVNASIVVTGEVFAGTRIYIGDASTTTTGGTKYCRFVLKDGDVRMTAI